MLKTVSAIATQIISSITGGLVQFTGPASGTTRVITVPNANATMARTDAAQSFTGDQTLSTGNLIIGTSGKGIDFSATPGTGTSELLNDYEEGTWSPVYETTGGSFTYAFQVGAYVKVGKLVTVTGVLQTATVTDGTGSVKLGGLPFATNGSALYRGGSGIVGYSDGWTLAAPTQAYWTEGQTSVNLQIYGVAGTSDLTVANLTAGTGNRIYFEFSYNV